jgi:hypothetical protein
LFLRTQLQLIQNLGYNPGNSNFFKNEKWITIKFQAAYAGPVNQSPYDGMYRFLSENYAEFPIMGRYRITGNQTGQQNSSYVIGLSAPPENKIWQYSPNDRILRFGTLEKWTGTAESNNEPTYTVTNDLELEHAVLSSGGFMVGGGGWNGYGQGRVNKTSWTHLPFLDGLLYWTTLPS